MRTLLALLPVAGCAAMMLACARMMRGGHSASSADATPADVAGVNQLRAEIAELRARLDSSDPSDRLPLS